MCLGSVLMAGIGSGSLYACYCNFFCVVLAASRSTFVSGCSPGRTQMVLILCSPEQCDTHDIRLLVERLAALLAEGKFPYYYYRLCDLTDTHSPWKAICSYAPINAETFQETQDRLHLSLSPSPQVGPIHARRLNTLFPGSLPGASHRQPHFSYLRQPLHRPP